MRYRILLLGYLLLFSSYFGVRVFQYATQEIASGEVRGIAVGKFVMGSRRGDYHGTYRCPEIHFLYKRTAADTGTWYIVRPESLSNKEYQFGEKTNVIFPPGHPEQASIYSLREFWFTTPYMIILSAISALWTIGFVVVVFKPWRQMEEV